MPTEKTTRLDNTKTWLEVEALKLGTDNQRARWRDNLLPEEELLELVRAEIFKPFAGIPRWSTSTKLHASDVRHKPDCWAAGSRNEAEYIEFDSEAGGETLDEKEYDTFQRIRAAVDVALAHPWSKVADLGWGIHKRQHAAHCVACKASAWRHSALVAVTWCGRTLSREYLL